MEKTHSICFFKLFPLNHLWLSQCVPKCFWVLFEAFRTLKTILKSKKIILDNFGAFWYFFSHNSKVTQNPLRVLKGFSRKKCLKNSFRIIFSTLHKYAPKCFEDSLRLLEDSKPFWDQKNVPSQLVEHFDNFFLTTQKSLKIL